MVDSLLLTAAQVITYAGQRLLTNAIGFFFERDGRLFLIGSPVVMRAPGGGATRVALPWVLLGIHSARLDVGTRDLELDEALGLNSAWYADILMTLTAPIDAAESSNSSWGPISPD